MSGKKLYSYKQLSLLAETAFESAGGTATDGANTVTIHLDDSQKLVLPSVDDGILESVDVQNQELVLPSEAILEADDGVGVVTPMAIDSLEVPDDQVRDIKKLFI